VRTLFKYLKFLPFVPPKDVIKAFKQIKSYGNSTNKFQSMFTYFERTYIGKLVKTNKTVRKIPPYPIVRWNVYLSVLQNKARTKNSQESWHRVFAEDAHAHTTMNKLIEHFRLEQKNTQVIVSPIQSGKLFLLNWIKT
jgi:hypothetical protein